MQPEQQNITQIVTMENLTLQALGTHMLFDEIDSTSAKAACEFIIKANMVFESSAPLVLLINSPGGSVSDGWAIVDVMATSAIPLNTVIIGEAASMAAIIFVGGTKGFRYMTHNSYMMTHQFWGIMSGKSHELLAVRKLHDDIDRKFIDHFKRNSKMSEKQIREILLHQSDSWLEPKECLKYGLCDKIVAAPWAEIRKTRAKHDKASS